MDVVLLLTDDHLRLRALFAAFERAAGDTERREIAAIVVAVLCVHTALEREILLPALGRATASAADEGQEQGTDAGEFLSGDPVSDETGGGLRPDHARIESSARRLRNVLAVVGPYEAEFVGLRHLVLMHCQEQEEVLFPAVRRRLGEQVERLGWLLAARRAELVAALGPAGP